MGLALVLVLLAAAAVAGGGGSKKPAPTPAPKPSDDEMKGSGELGYTGPSDSKQTLGDTLEKGKTPPAVEKLGPSGTSYSTPKTPLSFVDLDTSNLFAKDWIGVRQLPQPLRNLALNILQNVIYGSVMSSSPAPLCMKVDGCSSEAVFAVIKEVLKAGLKDSHQPALKELYAAYDKLREAGR